MRERRPLTQKGDATLVAKCPWRVGIVSTGLIVNGDDDGERGALAKKTFGVVILDEAHKARNSRGQSGREAARPNNLLKFLRAVARNASNVILGTATPIQLEAVELWDLLSALSQGAPQVLGTPFDGGEWMREESIQYLTHARPWPANETNRWGLFRNPLPPASEHSVFRDVRADAGIPPREVVGPRYDTLSPSLRAEFLADFSMLAERCNPIVRRVVRRTRPMLEQRGLLKPIGVVTHPRDGDGVPTSLFNGEGLEMSLAFKTAYEAAEAVQQAVRPASTRRRISEDHPASPHRVLRASRPRHGPRLAQSTGCPARSSKRRSATKARPTTSLRRTPRRSSFSREVERNLEAVVAGGDIDPKVQVVLHYLRNRQWLETNGAIIFSQYLTTAEWVLEALCEAFPNEPVALYAGGAASFVQRGQSRTKASREQIKRYIQDGEIRLVCATDAACEGLNLQRLGAQVNIDMPWNPSRLEQRKGRMQRIGQARDNVHVLNLRYAGTVEDEVYAALSHRFGDIFAVLGQLPDAFEDDWIDAVLKDRSAVQHFSQRVDRTRAADGAALPPRRRRRPRDWIGSTRRRSYRRATSTTGCAKGGSGADSPWFRSPPTRASGFHRPDIPCGTRPPATSKKTNNFLTSWPSCSIFVLCHRREGGRRLVRFRRSRSACRRLRPIGRAGRGAPGEGRAERADRRSLGLRRSGRRDRGAARPDGKASSPANGAATA